MAVSAALSPLGWSLAVSGAGAKATNIVLTTTSAGIHNSDVAATGDVTVNARNTSRVVATEAAIAYAVSGGTGGAAGL